MVLKFNYCTFIFYVLSYYINCGYEDDFYNLTKGRTYIYYQKKVANDNTFTGTGNKLKDVVYLSVCFTNCGTCCEGDLENMTCLHNDKCISYRNEKIPFVLFHRIISFIWIYATIPILWFISKFLDYKKARCAKCFKKIYEFYSAILIFPYGIVFLIEYLCKKKTTDEEQRVEKNKEKELETLFKQKFFQAEEFQNGVAKTIQKQEGNLSSEEDNIRIEIENIGE